jgi:hypothetical protein
MAAAKRAGASGAEIVERQVGLVAVGPSQGQLTAGDRDVSRFELCRVVGHRFH